MLNIKLLLNNVSYFEKKIKIRDKNFNINKILNIYIIYKKLLNEIEFMQYKHNYLSKKVFFYKKKKYDLSYLKYFIKLIKYNIIFKKKKINKILYNLNKLMSYVPNIISDDVPLGENDSSNKIIYKWGNIKNYNFKIIDHVNFGKLSNNIDFETSNIISGSSFSIIKNDICMLYRAISQFMLDTHVIINKYSEVYVPYIVKDICLYGTGQLPKFNNNLFHIFNEDKNNKLSLIPTAEVPLVNLFRNKILYNKDLPIKLVSYTPCFRYESKSYGKDNRGLIRLNQFDKVELIQIVKPKFSSYFLDKLVLDAEKILKMLKLPYRKVLLCSGSTNFSSSKTYDLEVWSPVNNSYIEVSSCSNTLDFQSRRINLRYKNIKNNKKNFLHILNGSGLAIGRVLVAIIENFQISSGLVKLPKVLYKYMNDKKYISCLKK